MFTEQCIECRMPIKKGRILTMKTGLFEAVKITCLARVRFNPQINISEVANPKGEIIQEEESSIEDEILNIQTDIILKSWGLNENIWNLAEDKKYQLTN
ncbi:hypothetical protein NPIL_10941 [Nephila pilipes]|uniref:Uncharacterized protein n=1 Tax=Nephila pilipes TaxID=299642 RepID=A0A8X6P2W4_NEPPI|nr:hypothetical protein NPIL_10941 [Nephila pilipes]